MIKSLLLIIIKGSAGVFLFRNGRTSEKEFYATPLYLVVYGSVRSEKNKKLFFNPTRLKTRSTNGRARNSYRDKKIETG